MQILKTTDGRAVLPGASNYMVKAPDERISFFRKLTCSANRQHNPPLFLSIY